MRNLAQLRARARRKAQDTDPDEIFISNNAPQIIDFGMYKGTKLCAAELAFKNPSYLFWCIAQGAFRGHLGFEAWKVQERVTHIRPPRKSPDNFCFDLQFDRKNRLIDYDIARKTKPVTKPRRLGFKVIRVKHLDLSLLSCRNPEYDRDYTSLLAKIREEFLPSGKLNYRDYVAFFADEENFDLSCRETHCPLVKRYDKKQSKGFG